MNPASKKEKRDNLIEEYRRYVRIIAAKMMRSLGVPQRLKEEFIAAGYLGLVEAAERYNPTSGASFKTFAFFRIRGAIIDSIRQSTQVSPKAYRHAKAASSVQSLREEVAFYSADPRNKARAESTQAKLAKVLDFLAQGALAYKLTLDEAEDEVAALVDQADDPELRLLKSEKSKKLRSLVETLPEKERYILVEHYYNGRSFIEIARNSDGMSKSWVSRLHSRALVELKEKLCQELLSSPFSYGILDGSDDSVGRLSGADCTQS